MDDKQRERLAELRERDAQRLEKEQEEAELRELDARELQAKLEAEGKKLGSDFEIVNNRLGGVYAIAKPDTRAIKNWEAADEKKRLNLEWQIGILRHYILPEDKRLQWAQLGAQRQGLVWQTADKFVHLMGVDTEALQKKP